MRDIKFVESVFFLTLALQYVGWLSPDSKTADPKINLNPTKANLKAHKKM